MTTASIGTTPDGQLPPELQTHREELRRAAHDPTDPPKDAWPEGDRVLRARGPERVAHFCVRAFHPHLASRKIAYLFVEKLGGTGGCATLANAAKTGAKLKFLSSGLDFVLTFSHDAWARMTFAQRVAVVDHELTHCDVESDSGKCVIVPHDLEEFGSTIRRFGLYLPDRRRFAELMQGALAQGDLFASTQAAETPSLPVRYDAGHVSESEALDAQGLLDEMTPDRIAAARGPVWDEGPPAVKAHEVTPLRVVP